MSPSVEKLIKRRRGPLPPAHKYYLHWKEQQKAAASNEILGEWESERVGVATAAKRVISESIECWGMRAVLASLEGVYTWSSKEKSQLSSSMTNPLVSYSQAQP